MALIPFLVETFNEPIIQLIAVLIVFGIGLIQGIILGRSILVRFPRLQNHLKTVSVTLFFLFLANAILSVPRFATNKKIDLFNLPAGNTGEIASSLFLIFGMRIMYFYPSSLNIVCGLIRKSNLNFSKFLSCHRGIEAESVKRKPQHERLERACISRP